MGRTVDKPRSSGSGVLTIVMYSVVVKVGASEMDVIDVESSSDSIGGRIVVLRRPTGDSKGPLKTSVLFEKSCE